MKIIFLFVCWSLWYLVFSSRTIMAPLLPVIETELVISHTLTGSLYLFLSIGSAISSLFVAGWLSLCVGYKKSITISLIFLTGSIFAMNFAETYNNIALLCFLIGLGSGVYIPCIIPIITSVFEPKDWGKTISFHETAAATSIFTIPLWTVFLLSFFQWRSLFIILSLTFLMASILFWFLAPNPTSNKKTGSHLSPMLRRGDFWIMLVLFSIAVITSNGLYGITPLFLVNEKAFELDMANKVFGLTRTGGFMAMMLTGFLLDRISSKHIMMVALLITGLANIGLATVNGFQGIVIMLFIQGTVSAAFFPTGLYAISKITTLDERGLFTSVCMGIATLLGIGLAPVFLGFMADIWSFQAGITIIGAITVLTCPLSRRLQKL